MLIFTRNYPFNKKTRVAILKKYLFSFYFALILIAFYREFKIACSESTRTNSSVEFLRF